MKTLIYPQNLSLERLYTGNGYSDTVRKNMIVRTLKIISKLTPTNYNTYRFNKQGYVYLSSRFKKRVLGNYYYDFHKEITEGEDPIVEMSSHYEVGKESKLYRLSKRYLNSPVQKFHYKERRVKEVKKPDFLSDQFSLHKLSFDNDVNTYLLNLHSEIGNRIKGDNQKVLLDNYIGRNLCIVDDINGNEIFYGRSKTNYRYYSSLTSLNRIIRPFILVNDKRLFSIDIKSSQPFILATILDSSYYNDNNILYNKNRINKGIGGIILFPRFLEGKDVGIKKYRGIPFYDDFYSHVLKNELGREPTKIERERLKQKTMQFLFFNNSKAKRKNELKYLVSQYPSINSFITSCLNVIGERNFSFILQRSESYLVLDVISKEFNERFPNEPIFTIHDAILTTEKNAEYMFNLMEKRLAEYTGIIPGLKLEKPEISVIPSEYDIQRITEKIILRSKKLSNVYNAVEVLESNLIRMEQLLSNHL